MMTAILDSLMASIKMGGDQLDHGRLGVFVLIGADGRDLSMGRGDLDGQVGQVAGEKLDVGWRRALDPSHHTRGFL